MTDRPDAPLDIEAVAKIFLKLKAKAGFRVTVITTYIKAFFLVLFRLFKARVALIVTWIRAKKGGIKFVTARQFLTEFPASKSCKKCNYGQGFIVVMDPKTKEKRINICDCSIKQCVKSGKKYIVRGIE